MNNIISVAGWCLDQDPVNSILSACRCKFNSMQINLGKPTDPGYLANPSVLKHVIDFAKKNGLKFTALAVNYINTFPLSEGLSNELDQFLEDSFHVARELACRAIIFPSFHNRLVRDDVDLQRLVEFFLKILERNQKYNLLVASENSLAVDQNLELFDKLSHPTFRINFDSYNPLLYNHDPVELYQALKHIVFDEIHIKDGMNNGIGNVGLGLGDGQQGRFLSLLEDTSFSGKLVLENKYYVDAQKKINMDVEFIKKYF